MLISVDFLKSMHGYAMDSWTTGALRPTKTECRIKRVSRMETKPCEIRLSKRLDFLRLIVRQFSRGCILRRRVYRGTFYQKEQSQKFPDMK